MNGVAVYSGYSGTVNTVMVTVVTPVGFAYASGRPVTLKLQDLGSTGITASRTSPISITLGLSSKADGSDATPIAAPLQDPISIQPGRTRNFRVRLPPMQGFNINPNETYFLTASTSTPAGTDGFGVSSAIIAPPSVSPFGLPVVRVNANQLENGRPVNIRLLNSGTTPISDSVGMIEWLGFSVDATGADPMQDISTGPQAFAIAGGGNGRPARKLVRVWIQVIVPSPGTYYLVANVTDAVNPLVLAEFVVTS